MQLPLVLVPEIPIASAESRLLLLVPNFVIKSFIRLLHNRDAPFSNFGPNNCYCFPSFPSSKSGKDRFLPRHAMTQENNGQHLTLERRVRTQTRSCRICGGQGFLVSTSIFACQHHSTTASFSYLNHLHQCYTTSTTGNVVK